MAEAVLAEPVAEFVKPKRVRKIAAVATEKPKRVRKPKMVAPVDPLEGERERLIAAEIAAVEKFYEAHPRALKTTLSIPDYVAAVFDAHAPLIRRWGGWRTEFSTAGAVPTLSLGEIGQALNGLMTGEFYQYFYSQRYGDAAIFPKIPIIELLYRTKIFNPSKTEKEREFEYMPGKMVKVRKGQAVAKAVLAQVKKDYKDEERMLRIFNRVFEQLGQTWSSVKGGNLVHVSCAPSAFLFMGHYVGADTASCFKTGGVSERTKTNLSLFPGSAVFLFYPDALTPDQTPEDRLPSKVSCRMYGAVRDTYLMVSNIQSSNYQRSWAQYAPVLCALFERETGIPGGKLHGTSNDGTFSTGYWEFNNLVASDGNIHIVADKGHKERFLEIRGELKTFAPDGHIKGGGYSYY